MLLGGEAGLRCGEMMALRWADVDFAMGQISIKRSDWEGQVTSPKSGKSRTVSMTTRLSTALKEHRHLRSGLVLCQDNGKPLTRQMVQTKAAGPARTFGLREGVHILRHTFCSHLAMAGAPSKAIQELAGHRSFATTQRYLHLSPSALHSAVKLLENRRGLGDSLETVTG